MNEQVTGCVPLCQVPVPVLQVGSGSCLTDGRRFRDPPDLQAALAAPFWDPTRLAADSYRFHSDLNREEPPMCPSVEHE